MASKTPNTALRLAAALALSGCAKVHFKAAPATFEFPPVPALIQQAGTPASGDLLIAGGIGTNLSGLGRTEFYQQSTGTPTAVLAAGGALLKAAETNGGVTYTGRPVTTAATFNSATGRFTASGTMVMARAMATATPLQDGTVLLAGGLDPLGRPVATAEIYDPATGKFTATLAPMHLPRALHTATRLGNGKVLIYGGITNKYGVTSPVAELYMPATRRFFKIPTPLPNALMGHTATLISGCGCKADGMVLLADGAISATNQGYYFELTLPRAMLYDPVTDTATAISIGAPRDGRAFHTATLLPGGKVLLAGGLVGDIYWQPTGFAGYSTNAVSQSAEIFDPHALTFSCVNGDTGFACNPSLSAQRGGHAAALLTAGPNAGKVLLAGGFSGLGLPTGSTELFDPVALTSSPGPTMLMPRALAGALQLP